MTKFTKYVVVTAVVALVHYEYIASAKMIPILHEAMLCIFEPRHFAASNYSKNVPRRLLQAFC